MTAKYWTFGAMSLSLVLGLYVVSTEISQARFSIRELSTAEQIEFFIHEAVGKTWPIVFTVILAITGLLLVCLSLLVGSNKTGRVLQTFGFLAWTIGWTPFFGLVVGGLSLLYLVLWVLSYNTNTGSYDPAMSKKIASWWSNTSPRKLRKYVIWTFVFTWLYAALLLWAGYGSPDDRFCIAEGGGHGSECPHAASQVVSLLIMPFFLAALYESIGFGQRLQQSNQQDHSCDVDPVSRL